MFRRSLEQLEAFRNHLHGALRRERMKRRRDSHHFRRCEPNCTGGEKRGGCEGSWKAVKNSIQLAILLTNLFHITRTKAGLSPVRSDRQCKLRASTRLSTSKT